MVDRLDDAAKVILEFQEIIRSNKKNTVWLAYQQDVIFQKFKEKEKFANMITEFGVSKSNISFKMG